MGDGAGDDRLVLATAQSHSDQVRVNLVARAVYLLQLDATPLGDKVDVDDVDVLHADLRQQSAYHRGPERRHVVMSDVACVVDLDLVHTALM